MPTGYTAGVVDGKVSDFPTFALQCARAFGALVEMRDDPWDAKIPDEMVPSSYHEERLAEAEAELAALKQLTAAEKEARAEAAYQEKLKSNREYDAARQLENARLQAMKEKVLAWVPPTPEHVGMKGFMLEQLNISFNKPHHDEYAVEFSPALWYNQALEHAEWNVTCHKKELEADIQRAAERTAWIRALKQSLKS